MDGFFPSWRGAGAREDRAAPEPVGAPSPSSGYSTPWPSRTPRSPRSPSTCGCARARGATSTRSLSRRRSTSRRPSARTARSRASACRTCSASRSAGTTTARGLLWTCRDVLVPSFRGSTKFELQVPCSTDLELATTRYFDAVPDGHAPLAFHFSGSVIYADGPDRMQVTRVPWHVMAQYRLPVEVWRSAAGTAASSAWAGTRSPTLRDYATERGLLSSDAAVADCWPPRGRRPGEPAAGGAGGLAPLRGVRPLPLHARGDEERHAHAVRHRLPAGLRRAQSELPSSGCGSSAWSRATARCRARCASSRRSGERHEGEARRIDLAEPGLRASSSTRRCAGAYALRTEPRDDGRRLVTRLRAQRDPARWHRHGPRRGAAPLAHLHPRAAAHARRAAFSRRSSEPGDNLNTYPVLATPEDDTVLGAAIVLPDHPQIAPESRGNLFDNTEIEEALLLHVHALSDAERDEIAQQDPAVREMIERAAATTPEDIMRLHGRVTMRDPRAGERGGHGRGRDLPSRHGGGAAPGPGARPVRPHAARPPGNDRADLPRLRLGPAAPGGVGRRRSGP